MKYRESRNCKIIHILFLISQVFYNNIVAQDIEIYKSKDFDFSFQYDINIWRLNDKSIEKNVDVILIYDENYGNQLNNITFGVFYDPESKNYNPLKVLNTASSELLFADLYNSPLISNIKILSEGKTILFTKDAYQIKSILTYSNSVQRYRHLYSIFNGGYWYSISIFSNVDDIETFNKVAGNVLRTIEIGADTDVKRK